MKNGKFVSIKAAADMLLQNPLMKGMNWEFIVSHAIECMRIVGTPAMFISDKEIVEVSNHKGSLPANMIKITQVMRVENNGDLTPMSEGQDTLHDHYGSFNKAASDKGTHTYSFNNSRIFPSFPDGKVLIVYDTIATDEDCYPLIPDNAELMRAIRSYIKYKWFDILNDMDKISDRKLNKAEVDYSWNVGQAQSNMQMPTIDEMEALTNQITQILPSRTQHAERFQFLGQQEFLKVQ